MAKTRQGVIESFFASVLTTNRPKYVQFLAFYYASIDSTFAVTFIDALITTMRNFDEPRRSRQCCALYCGSFIAHARFVSPAASHSALLALAEFANQYLANLSPANVRPSTALHPVFYSCVQALLYLSLIHI